MVEGKFGWRRNDVFAEYAHTSTSGRRIGLAERWPLLSADDIRHAGDDRALLAVRIAALYGISHEKAACDIAEWDAARLPVRLVS